MKTNSLILGAAALMLATSCSNDEVVKVADNGAAIGFNSFINKSTRATDYNNDNLLSFNVYGVMNNPTATGSNLVVFNGDEVSRADKNSAWAYTTAARYWTSDFDYTFAAIAPAGAATPDNDNTTTKGGVKALTFNNKDGQTDLLFDAVEVPTTATDKWGKTVNFNFGHILSRVMFKFTNDMPKGYSIKVTDVKLSGANNNATYTTASGQWSEAEGNGTSTVYEFAENKAQVVKDGTAETQPSYLIPSFGDTADENAEKVAYDITFTVELLLADAQTGALVSMKTSNLKATLPELVYKSGYSYSFNTKINEDNIFGEDEDKPVKIEFSASVSNWNEDELNQGYDLPVKPSTSEEGNN